MRIIKGLRVKNPYKYWKYIPLYSIIAKEGVYL